MDTVKKCESYKKTIETTKTNIKRLINLPKKNKTKAVFHEIVEKQGGIEKAIGGAFIPEIGNK